MSDWLLRMFDSEGFPPRWHCGQWSLFLGWLHIIADITIWIAYMGIPAVLLYFVRKRRDLTFLPIFVLFGLFIACCGFGHLLEAGTFWWPVYRLSATVKLATAIVSIATLIAMVPFTRRALALPGTSELLARLRSESAEHHLSKEVLQMTQEQLSMATQASGAGLWDWQITSGRSDWDTNSRAMFGLGARDAVGGRDFILDFVLPPDRDAVESAFSNCIDNKNQFSVRFRIKPRTGGVAHLVARGSLVQSGPGRPVRVSGAFFSLTEEERSREHFRISVEASPNAMLLVDPAGTILMANSNVERVFGYRRDDLVGTSIDKLVPPDVQPRHRSLREAFLTAPTTRPMGAGRDLHGLRRDGTEVPIEIGLNPIDAADGPLVLASIIDITERKHGEDMLRKSLAEKETMLREIHHRVKNNLQVVSSLLSLQANRIRDPSYRALFEDCQHRVRAMALIHERLYSVENLAEIEFGDYMRELTQMLARTYASGRGPIRIDHRSDRVRLDIQTSIPLGLIINELVTNALRHGFGDGHAGELRVHLSRVDAKTCRLTVMDDGVGLAPEFDPDLMTGIGMKLVRRLTNQIDGRFSWTTGKGATFVVDFPATGEQMAQVID